MDPNETAHHEQSHQGLHCLPQVFYFVTTQFAILFPTFVYASSLFEITDSSKFKVGRVRFRKSGVKELKRYASLKSLAKNFITVCHININTDARITKIILAILCLC